MTALCTLADVKKYVPEARSSTALDELISLLITTQSARIESYLLHTIGQDTYTDELLSGDGSRVLAPRNFPITAVSSLEVDGVAWTQSMSAVLGYSFNQRFLIANTRFPKGTRNVKVTYTAGYTTVPEDIKQACMEMVALRLDERKRIGVSSQSIAGESVSYKDQDMPMSVQATLQKYRSYVAATV